MIEEVLVSNEVVTCELYKKMRSCQQRRRRGEKKLTIFEFESDLELGLDPVWIRFEETRLVDEMLMVVILIIYTD